jgi:hypothetical protein
VQWPGKLLRKTALLALFFSPAGNLAGDVERGAKRRWKKRMLFGMPSTNETRSYSMRKRKQKSR